MAKQSGIIKLKGTVGGISFYKSKDGYLAREKGGVDGDRIKKDPAFKRTIEMKRLYLTLEKTMRLLLQT